jgi:hypothetical protein
MSLKRLSVVMLLLSTGSLAIAQQAPRFEAGPIVACVSDCNDHPNWGWGARGTVNLTNVFGGEAQIFEHQANHSIGTDLIGTFNLKATWRLESRYRFNLFALAGPGFVRTNALTGITTAPFPQSQTVRTTQPLLDLGGGAEFVPFRQFAFRVDITHFTLRNPCNGSLGDPSDCYLQSFPFAPPLGATTVKAGFMFRFP